MADYECPECHGGAPSLVDGECLWCGFEAEHEPGDTDDLIEDRELVNTNIQTPRTPPEGLDFDPKELDIDALGPRRPGTTPCPDCGDPMPMVTWTGEKPLCDRCSRKRRNESVFTTNTVQRSDLFDR